MIGRVRNLTGTSTRDALAVAMQIGQPVLLWGAPGEGKSAVIEQVAAQLDRPCEVIIGSVREASDFAGLPMLVGNGVTFAPPTWAQRCIDHPDTVVFFDELTTAQPSVQAAMLRVVLERQVGELRLPDTVAIVAAANPPELAAGGDDLSAPLANRFCHLDWEADTTTWLNGMLTGWSPEPLPVVPANWETVAAKWRAVLAAFIRARPSALRQVPTDTVSQGRAWASPRSWDRAHRIAAAAEASQAGRSAQSLLVAGLVGDGLAIEFLRFAAEADLPDPEAILLDPSMLEVNARSDLLLAALGSVVGAVAMDPTVDRWTAAWDVLARCCEQDRADVASMSAMDLLALREPGWPAPRAAAAFAGILREAALL